MISPHILHLIINSVKKFIVHMCMRCVICHFFFLFISFSSQTQSMKMDLMMCIITVFSISLLCYVVGDLDNPFSGYFRVSSQGGGGRVYFGHRIRKTQGESSPPPPRHIESGGSYAHSLNPLSWALLTIGSYKKHPPPPLFRASREIFPNLQPQNTPFPEKIGHTHAATLSFECGGGGGGE